MAHKKQSEIAKISVKIDKAITELYDALCNKVLELQGGKEGYVETQDNDKDKIYFYCYTYGEGSEMNEGVVCGIRTVKNGTGMDLQIVGTEVDCVRFDEESFQIAAENNNKGFSQFDGDFENCWQTIRGNDRIHFIPTVLAIAEVIDQYDNTALALLSTDDEIFIDTPDSENPGFYEEICYTGTFMDGHAETKDEEGNKMTIVYPKVSELTEDMIDEIEEYTGRKLLEYHQIALVYGELKTE